MRAENEVREIDHSKYDFRTKEKLAVKLDEGLSEKTVREISTLKKEPAWMLELRLKSYQEFLRRPVPAWGANLEGINFNEIDYYARQDAPKARNWEDVPKEIKDTFEKLGVPEAERKFLAGSIAQFKSEAVYHNLKKNWEEKGVVFTDMDTALQKYPEIVRKHFMRAVPFTDNKFAALHGAVWSGGTFLHVPKNVKIDLPLQNYFRMNSGREGMFEHTMIILEEGAKASYVEGCTAPRYEEASMHSAIIEVFVGENAQASYTSVQNWSKNIYNMNTKRALVEKKGRMQWVDGSLGSKVTMLYPMSVLRGEGASTSNYNMTFSSEGSWKDTGAKVIHAAPNTTSKIVAKSISMSGGIAAYRGLLRINKGALNAKSHVQCDALILDDSSKTGTYPHNEIYEPTASFGHEASVGKISDEQVFYLMNRGLKESEAKSMIVLGFLDEVLKEIPFEYSVEFNRLVKLEFSKLGAVG
ncbi:MAG: Fe-S cluster assembly protein SufB [Candidatus Micrarchaeota archaeon]